MWCDHMTRWDGCKLLLRAIKTQLCACSGSCLETFTDFLLLLHVNQATLLTSSANKKSRKMRRALIGCRQK